MLRFVLIFIVGFIFFILCSVYGPDIIKLNKDNFIKVTEENNEEIKNVDSKSINDEQYNKQENSEVAINKGKEDNKKDKVLNLSLADKEKIDKEKTEENNEEIKSNLSTEEDNNLLNAIKKINEDKVEELNNAKNEAIIDIEEMSLSNIVEVQKEIQKGDNVMAILNNYTDRVSAYNLSKIIDKAFSVRSFRIDNDYKIIYDSEEHKINYFEYEVSANKKLVVEFNGENYKAKIVERPYIRKLSFIEGKIENNLFSTIDHLNEYPKLALQVENMFKWDINFVRDIQKNDSFSILVEKLYLDDKFVDYGRTLGATFINNGKKYESFLFYDANKKENHYNAKGENKRKVLLKSPLSVMRITSGYTHRRKHPIFGNYRPHLGIDYGAPTGTRIMAVGDGIVTYCGWRGGYGRHIIVKHAYGLESLYSHLSRYEKGIKKGVRVSQGQTIGRVGSSGYSTGPHLDFRLRQNGKFINPGKAINPRAAAVSKVHKVGYEERKKIIREYIDGTRKLDLYNPKEFDVPK